MLSDQERMRNADLLAERLADADFDEATALLAVADLFRSLWWDGICQHFPCPECAPEYTPGDAEEAIDRAAQEIGEYLDRAPTQSLEEDGMALMFLLEHLATGLAEHDGGEVEAPRSGGRGAVSSEDGVIQVDFGSDS